MLRILLYRSNGLLSRLIRWQTRSVYSHAAFLFDDGTIIESHLRSGVISREITVNDFAKNVDWFCVDCSEGQEEAVREVAERRVGCKYDLLAILRFVSRRRLTNDRKWFCSELCFDCCKTAGIRLLERIEAWKVSPGLLACSTKLTEDVDQCRMLTKLCE